MKKCVEGEVEFWRVLNAGLRSLHFTLQAVACWLSATEGWSVVAVWQGYCGGSTADGKVTSAGKNKSLRISLISPFSK